MPKYRITAPDGRVVTMDFTNDVDAVETLKQRVIPDMTQRAADVDGQVQDMPGAGGPPPQPMPQPRRPIDPALLKRNLEMDRERYNPAKGMSWLEKAGVGFQGGLRDVATGVGSLVGLADESDIEARKEREETHKPLGMAGTVGKNVAEGLVTLPIGGPVAGAAGKVLTKAIPAAEAAAKLGGKYLNVGTFANAATQGAVAAGVTGDSTDKTLLDRADNVAQGIGGGLTAPLVMKLVALPIQLAAG